MFGLSKPPSKALAGAKLAQQQNQAPDSIPGMFKPGEFVLPPDTVHAMGGKQALQGVVDATHTPVAGGFGLRRPPPEPAAKPAPGLGLRPEVFFANGGAPEDQLRTGARALVSPGNTFPQASPSAGANIYAGAGLSRDQFGSSGRIAQVPASIGQQPGRQAPVPAAQAPAAQAAAPAASPVSTPSTTPAPASTTPGAPARAATRTPGASELYMKDRAQEMSDQWGSGNYAQAAGTAGRTAVQGLGMYGLELADKTITPAGNAIGGFAKGLFGINDAQAAQLPATAAPAAAPAVKPGTGATPASAPAAATATAPAAQTASSSPVATSSIAATGQAAPATTATAPAPSALPTGVYNHGRGQYSDQSAGMGLPAGFTGRPNAQNDAAASALAQSGGFGLRRPVETAAPEAPGLGLYGGRGAEAGTQPGWSGSIGQSSGNGNSWGRTPEQQRRDAETQASSIHRQTAANGAAALRSLDGRDLERMRGTNALEQENLRQAGGLQRTAMSEAGANQRAALAESGASSRASGQLGLGLRRLSLDQQRASSEDRLREPQIRAAERQGQLQEAYLNAKTQQERDAIASQMRAYSGKDEADWKVQVTPATKNVDGSTTAGSVIRYNSRTGDVQDVGGVGGRGSAGVAITDDAAGRTAFAQLPSGATYTGPDGKQYKKN